jgi:hypothetical protein
MTEFNETVSVYTAYNPSLYVRDEVVNFQAACGSVSELEDSEGKTVYGEYISLHGSCTYFFKLNIKPLSVKRILLKHGTEKKMRELVLQQNDVTKVNDSSFGFSQVSFTLNQYGLINELTEGNQTKILNEELWYYDN